MTTKVVVGVLLLVLVGYGFIEARPLLLGPSLTLSSPEDYASLPSGVVEIHGTVERTVALTLDGAPLLPDEKGAFSSTLALSHGTSILTLTAADRFGRSTTLIRTIFVP